MGSSCGIRCRACSPLLSLRHRACGSSWQCSCLCRRCGSYRCPIRHAFWRRADRSALCRRRICSCCSGGLLSKYVSLQGKGLQPCTCMARRKAIQRVQTSRTRGLFFASIFFTHLSSLPLPADVESQPECASIAFSYSLVQMCLRQQQEARESKLSLESWFV